IYLFHLLGDEAELRSAIGINLFFVAEGDGFQRQDRFACLVHRLDCFLKACGGGVRAKMAVGVHDNWYTCWNGCPSNPCNVCIRLRSCCPDANGVGFTRDTSVIYRDIVVAVGGMRTAAESNS